MASSLHTTSSKNDSHLTGQALAQEGQLTRVYQLRGNFQQKQDIQTTEDAINELVAIIKDAASTKVLLRAAFSTLVTILSNVQAKSMSADTVNELYKLLGTKQQEIQDENLLARLKICELTLAKSSQAPDKHILDAIVRALAEACFTGVRGQIETLHSRQTAAPPTRMQASTSGTMGSFTLPRASVPVRRTAARKGSTSSVSSRRSTRSWAASESDSSETDNGRTQMQDSAAIRLEALRVLSTLAKADTRALHPFWSLYFGPSASPSLFTLAQRDLSLVVRLQAMQTIRCLLTNSKAYLDIARESKTKLAFTPLSQTLAEIANNINLQTLNLLQICFNLVQATDMLAAALQLTQVVISNTPHARLSSSHLEAIVRLNLDNIARVVDPAVLDAMSGVFNASSGVDLLTESGNRTAEVLDDTFKRALSARKSDEETTEKVLWQLIASLARLSSAKERIQHVEQEIIGHIIITFSDAKSSIQDAYLKVIAALDKPGNTKLISEALHSLLTGCADLQAPTVQASFLALVCQNEKAMQRNMVELVDLVTSLAGSSPSKEVGLQAAKSLGVLLQSSTISERNDLGRRCFSELERIARQGLTLAIRAEASWNLANIVDSPRINILSPHNRTGLLQAAISQIAFGGASRDADMIRTSAIRTVGALLARTSDLDLDIQRQARSSLTQALLSGSPKAQWNAAIALTRLIQANDTEASIVKALLTALETSQNIKVQASVVQAMEAMEQNIDSPLVELEAGVERILSRPCGDIQAMTYDQAAKIHALDTSLRELQKRLRAKRQGQIEENGND